MIPWELAALAVGLAFVAGWGIGVGGALAAMNEDQRRQVQRDLFLQRARREGVL